MGGERAPVLSVCRDTAGQERFRTITTAYYRGAMVGARRGRFGFSRERGLRAEPPCSWPSAGAVPGAGRWAAAVTQCELTPRRRVAQRALTFRVVLKQLFFICPF